MQKFILGKRKFSSKKQILQLVGESKFFDVPEESAEESDALLIFKTSKQQTWLVTTSARLYCVLDDARRPEPELQWVLQKDDLISGDEIIATIRTSDKSKQTGLLDIGLRHNWLFSKELFYGESLEEALLSSLRNRMIRQ